MGGGSGPEKEDEVRRKVCGRTKGKACSMGGLRLEEETWRGAGVVEGFGREWRDCGRDARAVRSGW